jgi:hypothetical protein
MSREMIINDPLPPLFPPTFGQVAASTSITGHSQLPWATGGPEGQDFSARRSACGTYLRTTHSGVLCAVRDEAGDLL